MRIPINAYLIRSGKEVILVDAGYGDAVDPADEVIRPPGPVAAALAAEGVGLRDVTIVVLTHLHADHVGGLAHPTGVDRAVAFENARIVVQRDEWSYSRSPLPIHRSLYRTDLLDPIMASGALELVDGEVELTRSVACLLAPGHTPGHQVVLIDDEVGRAVLLGDAATVAEQFFDLTWTSPYDADPVTAIRSKREIRRRLGRGAAWLGFAHDAPRSWAPEQGRSED